MIHAGLNSRLYIIIEICIPDLKKIAVMKIFFSSIFWIGEMGAGWITKFVMANYWIYPPPPTHYYWALPYVQNIFTCLQFIQLTSLPKPHHHYPLPIQDVSSVCDQHSAVILHQNHSCKGHLHEKLYYIRLAEKNSSTPFPPKIFPRPAIKKRILMKFAWP